MEKNEAYAIRVDGSKPIHLRKIQTDATGGMTHDEGVEAVGRLGAELSELQDLLFFAGMHSLLIVLQGRDTSGKDGTIRKVLEYTSVQSCRVEPFKVPTVQESAHDFLWRVHQRTPAAGSMVIFNRSHYEDVLVPRVHKLVPEEVWRGRYKHIRHFERLLADNRTILVKFCLHISPSEQKHRLLDREKEPEKAWKLSVGDWKERELWDAYTDAYDDAINECSTPEAPWYVVPADHKWFRNVAVMEQLVAALKPHKKEWLESLEETGRKARAELKAYRLEKDGAEA